MSHIGQYHVTTTLRKLTWTIQTVASRRRIESWIPWRNQEVPVPVFGCIAGKRQLKSTSTSCRTGDEPQSEMALFEKVTPINTSAAELRGQRSGKTSVREQLDMIQTTSVCLVVSHVVQYERGIDPDWRINLCIYVEGAVSIGCIR